MGAKKKVSVNIDENVFKRSKELGVNISQACTNYLKLLNSQIEATLQENKSFLGKASFTKEGLVRLPGFEPGSSTWQADVLNQARLQPLSASLTGIENTLIKLKLSGCRREIFQTSLLGGLFCTLHFGCYISLIVL